MQQTNALIIGSLGQIGSVLYQALEQKLGKGRVIGCDLKPEAPEQSHYHPVDILQKESLRQLIQRYRVTQIYHLAAILSAKGEQNPKMAWDINMNGLFHVLDIAVEEGVSRVFFPSSIAVFGPSTPKVRTPQFTTIEPTTVYGISKQAGEQWCQYYHQRYGLDVRSVRYPGIISWQSLPGGGTTDYAVHIYHAAVKGEPYTCFLGPQTRLPMMYMDDAIAATLGIMEAPAEAIRIRTSYNISGIDFTPEEIYENIRETYPSFQIRYEPDFRQAIADSWPQSISDEEARTDWGWKPRFDLGSMSRDMIQHLSAQYFKPQASIL